MKSFFLLYTSPLNEIKLNQKIYFLQIYFYWGGFLLLFQHLYVTLCYLAAQMRKKASANYRNRLVRQQRKLQFRFDKVLSKTITKLQQTSCDHPKRGLQEERILHFVLEHQMGEILLYKYQWREVFYFLTTEMAREEI